MVVRLLNCNRSESYNGPAEKSAAAAFAGIGLAAFFCSMKRRRIMPKTKFQEVIFTILMEMVMVYAVLADLLRRTSGKMDLRKDIQIKPQMPTQTLVLFCCRRYIHLS